MENNNLKTERKIEERKLYTIDDLFNLAEKIENKDLRDKVINFINNPLPTHEDISDTKINLEDSPASIKWNH